MIKIILLFLTISLYASNTNVNIKNTKSNIILTKNKISNMNASLDKLVKQINIQTDILNNINKKISKLNNKISVLKRNLNKNKKKLRILEQQKRKLEKQKNKLQTEVIEFISNNYTAQNQEISSVEDLINSEILVTVSKISGRKMSSIASLYSQIANKIKRISYMINIIKNSAVTLEKKKQELAKLKQQQYQKLKLLNAKKITYKQKLKQLIDEQNQMQNQLTKLNIIQKEKAKKEREEAKRRAEMAYKRKMKYRYNSEADKIKVKDYGDVYMKTKTARYSGYKTISPVKNAKIIKKFGAYIDPIYHISLYNDSITLQTKPNAKVRAIFDGRVVFVNNQNNNKMIVIQHRNHLHSIYAKLSRISPFIKKGYRVRKGDIIAKTDGKLEFEVTYKTYPIDPLQVINLK